MLLHIVILICFLFTAWMSLEYSFIPQLSYLLFRNASRSFFLAHLVTLFCSFLRLCPATIESSRRLALDISDPSRQSVPRCQNWDGAPTWKQGVAQEGTIESGSHVKRHLTGTYESNRAFHRRSCPQGNFIVPRLTFRLLLFFGLFFCKLSFSRRDTSIELIIKVSDRWSSCGRHFLNERIQNVDQIS